MKKNVIERLFTDLMFLERDCPKKETKLLSIPSIHRASAGSIPLFGEE